MATPLRVPPRPARGRSSTSRRWRRAARVLPGLFVGLALLLAVADPADAHAGLVESVPAADAVEFTSPDELLLRFTESVEVPANSIRVLDAAGEDVDLGEVAIEGPVVTMPFGAELPSGGYVVSWRVISADGHVVQGGFSFSVGQQTDVDPSIAASVQSASTAGDDPFGVLLRAITYLAVLGAAGVVIVGHELHRRGDGPVVDRLTGGLAVLGLLAQVLQVPIQAAALSGDGWSSVLDGEVLRTALGNGYGPATVSTVIGLAAIALTTGLSATTTVRRTAWTGAVLALLGLPIVGHTRTLEPLVFAMTADVVHVLAGAVWFGGLYALIRIVRRRRAGDDPIGAGEAVASFSGVAAASVAAIAVAGVVLGWMGNGGPSGLPDTRYGRLLLLKVGLVLVVLVGAWWNRNRFVPGLGRGDHDDRSWSRFDRVVRGEIVGIVAVLCVTAVLVNTTPGRVPQPGASDGGADAVAVEPPDPIEAATVLDGEEVRIELRPGRIGDNALLVEIDDENGEPSDRYRELRVTLSSPEADIVGLDADVRRIAIGRFRARSFTLPVGGDWEVEIGARPDRFTEITATAAFTTD